LLRLFGGKGMVRREDHSRHGHQAGEVVKDSMNGVDFPVKKMMGKMVVLESQDN
jgi:hypothetical protein